MKKYLKTVEDIEALRNTDTKIYVENHGGYFKFINGVLCSFTINSELSMYNAGISWVVQEYYIEVEDEPSEDDIGKLGWFWDVGDAEDGFIDELATIDVQPIGSDKYFPKYGSGSCQHFRPLTPEEVEKYTGYKVVKED